MFATWRVVKVHCRNYSCHNRLLSMPSLELSPAYVYLMPYKSAKQYHNRLGVVISQFCTGATLFQKVSDCGVQILLQLSGLPLWIHSLFSVKFNQAFPGRFPGVFAIHYQRWIDKLTK